MSKYTDMASEIISGVGGGNNVIKVIHCITRLRFTLKDKELADSKKIESINGVSGVIYNQNLDQYQVIIGQTVEDVYEEVINQLGNDKTNDTSDEKTNANRNSSNNPIAHAFQVVIGTITGSMIPIIGLLAAGGMINGLLSMFVKGNHFFELIDPASSTYTIISTMAMAPFYFLPVLVGFSAAKQLAPKDTTLPFIGASVGAFMIAPGLNPLTQATISGDKIIAAPQAIGELLGVTFNTSYFGIPVNLPSYAYSIFPVIVAVAIAKPLNAWLKDHLPVALRPIFQPMITFFVASSIVLIFVGPVISTISSGISKIIDVILGLNLGLAGIIVGGFYQCLVIFGLHWLVVPLISQQIAETGASSLNMIVSFTMLAQGTGALAVFFKTRKKELKGLAAPAAISAFCGVTEPAMYGINLKYIRVFIMSSIGAAVGAGVAGFMGLQMFGFSGSLIGFPNFISNPITHEAPAGNLAVFWIASLICMAVSFLLVWFFGYKDSDEMGVGLEKKNIFKDAL